jgi:hypothetical protein
MITIKEWMELTDCKISEGSSYGWSCYGPYSYSLDSWNGVHNDGGYSFSITFSTKSQKVYEVSVCDYTNNRAYRMINPKFQDKHRKEAMERGVNSKEAWDDVDYIDLEVDDDFIQKCLAIKAGESYDTRVQVPLDLPEESLYELMRMAHEKDITLNQLVESLLREFIADHQTDQAFEKFVVDSKGVQWPFATEPESD